MGWPDGDIPHGHVDVQVRGCEEDYPDRYEMERWVQAQLSTLCTNGEDLMHSEVRMLSEKIDDYDTGEVFAEVVDGAGDALMLNPIGKQIIQP